jgi:hypothetical protein
VHEAAKIAESEAKKKSKLNGEEKLNLEKSK